MLINSAIMESFQRSLPNFQVVRWLQCTTQRKLYCTGIFNQNKGEDFLSIRSVENEALWLDGSFCLGRSFVFPREQSLGEEKHIRISHQNVNQSKYSKVTEFTPCRLSTLFVPGSVVFHLQLQKLALKVL